MSDLAQLIQGSDEWRRARCGSLGASSLHEAIAKTKTGWGASRESLMADLIVERLTGEPTGGYVSRDMQHGIDTEPEARSAYEFYRDVEVTELGLVLHPQIRGSHASPDGLVNADGLIEVKCCKPSTHLRALLGEKLPEQYRLQALWQLACMPERRWVDLAYYSPVFPEEMRLFVRRIERDDKRIGELEALVEEFLAELAEKLVKLCTTVGFQEPA